MTVRNLDRLFRPRSIALIGASRRAGALGTVLARNMTAAGFPGVLMAVHPEADAIAGIRCYRDIAALPETPDLAVIATPPDTVPGLIDRLARRGAGAAVVITAGFSEGGREHGRALQREMCEAARPALLRVVGPNCLGVLVPEARINASFAHVSPKPGAIACVAQSGAVIAAVLDWAYARGIGFSHLVSLGDVADVDFGDMLDYLAADAGTRSILLYVEAVTAARKFMSAARAAARAKPVIVIKAGRHPEGAKAVASHTGALAGADAVYDAAFRRAGMLRVRDLDELFDAAATLAEARTIDGDRLAIVTNGGGVGILATDALMDRGGRLATLAPETLAALDAVLPATWSRGNPVDIIGDADGARYAAAIERVLADDGADAVLALNCPTAVASSAEAAGAVADMAARSARPVLAAWLGAAGREDIRRRFAAVRVPCFDTPESAVRGFMHVVEYRRAQAQLMETPPSLPADFSADATAARTPIDAALAEGRALLSEVEAKSVLAAYGVPVTPTRIARDAAEAAAMAAALGRPAALKILSPDITHKTDVGGVALNLETAEAVRAAAVAMASRVRAAAPQARIDGFTVQPMERRADAVELIVGASEDPQFGPVILFGQGGVAVEVVQDTAIALPPLNLGLARALMARTRVNALLQGYRGRAAAAVDEVALVLVRVSQLLVDCAEIAELDINPLLARPDGVVALDARIRVARAARPGAARLAIRPYPKELERRVTVRDGSTVLLRPVRPEDEPLFHTAFRKLSPESVRLRFFAPLKHLTHEFAARLTQIDYDREMALIAVPADAAVPAEVFGVARFAADPDGERAEYAVVVRSDATGRGLSVALMEHLIGYAKGRGLKELYSHVLAENRRMLNLCQRFGFAIEREPEDYALVMTRLRLG
jgi:acetyltransferase